MAIKQKPQLVFNKSIKSLYGFPKESVYDLLGRRLSNNPALAKDIVHSKSVHIFRLKSNNICYKKDININ